MFEQKQELLEQLQIISFPKTSTELDVKLGNHYQKANN